MWENWHLNRRTANLGLVIVFTEIAVDSVFLDNGVLRILLTLPLVLFLPGYTLTTVVFSKYTLEGIERLLFSIGISLAITVIGGLVLQLTPAGLQTISWLALLGGFTLATSLIGLILRQREIPRSDPGRMRLSLSRHETIFLALAVFVVVGAIGVARIGVFQQPTSPFTQLWMLSADAPDPNTVQIGVRNLEAVAKQYQLQVQISGQVTHEWSNIILEPDETWETTMILPVNATGADTVDALLFLQSNPQAVYRRASLWINSVQNR